MHYSAHDLSETIVALSTPPGTGALGVIRLSGAAAIRIIDEVFPSKQLAAQPTHTLHVGSVRHPEGGHVLDEVVVSLFRGPKSYTGEDVVEVSCHGSPYIIQQLLQVFTAQGARLARPGEFTLRAFMNGRIDLSQAEAVADLIASASAGAHQIALQQMRGGFSHDIQALRQELLDFASLIELELDFSEEDVEFADRGALRLLVVKIQKLIRRLSDSFHLGNAIKNGVSTVIAGRPNAGKSTLLNALLNEERAIVSEIAGTTRDTIEEVLNIEGIPFRIIDTAGIRQAQDRIEALGVEKTMEKIEQSKVLIYVFDVIQTSPYEVRQDLARLLRPGMHLIAVANKMDLNPHTKYEHYASELLPPERFVPISAMHRMNIDYLKEQLHQAVVSDKVTLDDTIVSNARHYEALNRAWEALQDVLVAMDEGVTFDFVAMDIRRAITFLGEITGQVSTEDLLGNIFGRFCIGK